MRIRLIIHGIVVASCASLLTTARAEVREGCDQIHDPILTIEACAAEIEDPETSVDDRVTALINRAIALGEVGEVEHALHDFDAAIRLNPNDYRIYYNRAVQYARLMQHQEALQDTEMLVQLQPDNYASYVRRGDSYYVAGAVDSALQDFESAINLNPDHPSAYAGRAAVLAARGEFDASMREGELVRELDPVSLKDFVFTACRPDHEQSAARWLSDFFGPHAPDHEETVRYLSDTGYDVADGGEGVQQAFLQFVYDFCPF